MQNILGGLTPVSVLAPIDAANTAAATSGWIATSGYVGLLSFVCYCGVLDAGSLDWTFKDASTSGGGSAAAVTPLGGALTQITTANDDPNIQIAQFDARQSRGWMQAIGTIVTGGALVSVNLIALPQYP